MEHAPIQAQHLADVWARLDLVMDPELDEPVTDMGFVEAVALTGPGTVAVSFRLPTYWCSPNFAFLMAQGIKQEVEVLPWVSCATVTLQDHMSAEAMNAAVNAGGDFSDAFTELTKGEDLSALRAKFDRKAFQRRQEVVIKTLISQGFPPEAIVAMTLSALDDTAFADAGAAHQKTRYRALLLSQGLAKGPDDPALVTWEGAPITVEGFAAHMGLLRSVRINMEFSGSLCRGLKRSRYLEADTTGEVPILVDFAPRPQAEPAGPCR